MIDWDSEIASATESDSPTAKLWRQAVEGDPWPLLHHLLDYGQLSWLCDFDVTDGDWGWLVARQRGKSDAAIAYGVVNGVDRHQRFRTKYCALTKDTALEISTPILDRILADCPNDIRPRLGPSVDEKGQPRPRHFIFPTNKQNSLTVFGTDMESFRKGRGGNCELLLFDEVGFYQKLEETESALEPSLQTTNGRMLYLSSPAESPGHAYTERCRTLRGAKRLIHDTFWSNPRIDHAAIIRRAADKRGMTPEEFKATTFYRREYLAEEVTEETRAALPAWPHVETECTVDRVRPQHFDGYASFDWGGVTGDPHASLWGVFDFASQHLHVEAEYERRGATVEQVVGDLKRIEGEVWGVNKWDGTLLGAGEFERQYKTLPDWLRQAVSDKAPRQPYLRTCDTNQEQLQQELLIRHGYVMLPWEKPDKHLRVDHLNNFIRRKQLSISPKCKRLLEQLHTTVWDEKRKTWVRTAKDHGDLVDCLVGMVWHLHIHRDCRPVIDTYLTKEPPKVRTWADLSGATRRVKRY